MRHTPIIVSLICVGLFGCLGTARIRTPDTTRPGESKTIDGIPFYPKRALCAHETVWIEPVYVLTREDTSADDAKETRTAVKVMRRSSLASGSDPLGKLHALEEAFNTAAVTPSGTTWRAFDDAWHMIASDGNLGINKPLPEDVVLGGNSVKSETFVDYTQPFYFNTYMPWIGSSTANATLADDGSLTTAQATTDNQTVKAVLDLLPVSAFLSARLGLTAAKAAATSADSINQPPPKDAKMKVGLKIETSLYSHTFRGRSPQTASPCTVSTRIPITALDDDRYEYQWSDLSAPTKSDQPPADPKTAKDKSPDTKDKPAGAKKP
jgi:hypothetical protein